jgi:Mg2+ and Co2+ transporter CorA
MHVRYLTPGGAEVGSADDLVEWRGRRDGFMWVDLDACDETTARLLNEEFGFHPQAISTPDGWSPRRRRSCRTR